MNIFLPFKEKIKRASLQQRILNAVLITCSLIFLAGIAENFFTRSPLILTTGSLLGFIIFLLLSYLSFSGKFLFPALLGFSLILFLFVPPIWFLKGGIRGAFPYFLLLYAVMVAVVFRGRLRTIFLLLTLLMAIFLTLLENSNLKLIGTIHSPQLVDYLVGFFLNSFAIVILVIHLSNNYEKLRAKLEFTNKRLIFINEKLKELSLKDPLTGLSNRRDAIEKFNYLIKISKRNREPIAIILADIDNFKRINDLYGHSTGDMVLKRIAKELSQKLREQDILARWGGDEFLLLLPGTTGKEALKIADRLRMTIESMNSSLNPARLRISMSFGVTEYDHSQESIQFFIDKADRALYYCKKQGKNCVTFIPPMPS